jgi:hypothetical protein
VVPAAEETNRIAAAIEELKRLRQKVRVFASQLGYQEFI